MSGTKEAFSHVIWGRSSMVLSYLDALWHRSSPRDPAWTGEVCYHDVNLSWLCVSSRSISAILPPIASMWMRGLYTVYVIRPECSAKTVLAIFIGNHKICVYFFVLLLSVTLLIIRDFELFASLSTKCLNVFTDTADCIWNHCCNE